MINPNNQRIVKIMELLEQTKLFTSDELTKLEDYLLEGEADNDEEHSVLASLEFQDLSKRLSNLQPHFAALFTELMNKGGSNEAEKLAEILFAVGKSTCRTLFPERMLSNASMLLSSKPAKKAALYAAQIGHAEHLLRSQPILNLIQVAGSNPMHIKQAIHYQKEEEGNGRLILLTAYFFLQYPETEPDTITEIDPEDADWLGLYERILINSLEGITFKKTALQELQKLVEEDNIDSKLSKLAAGAKTDAFVLRIVSSTAFVNFSLSTRIRNIMKICLTSDCKAALNAMEKMDLRQYLKNDDGKLEKVLGIDVKRYIHWAVEKKREDILKSMFIYHQKEFMEYKKNADFNVCNMMTSIIKQLDPKLYEEDKSKQADRQQMQVINTFISFCSGDAKMTNDIKEYLSGEIKIDALGSMRDNMSNQWRWSYVVWQVVESYQKAYGNDVFSNRCEALMVLGGGLSNYYYVNALEKTGTEGAKRVLAIMESEGLTPQQEIAAYVDLKNSSSYSAEKWDSAFKTELENVFEKHLEEKREETLVAFREAESIGRSFGLKVLAKDPQKNKEEILRFAQDTSKAVKEDLLSVLYEQTDWKEDMIALLSSKKAADREIAVRVLAKWDSEAYAPLISEALEKEKNAKVRTLMENALNIGGKPGSSSLTQADLVKEMHKGGKKRALAWAYETPFSTVHRKNGEEAEEEYMQAILLCYSTMGSYGVSASAASLAEDLNENELAVYANELFDKWMEAGAESKKRWVLYASAIHGGSEIIRKLQHQLQEWPQAARGAIAAEAVQALALNPLPQALLIVDGISRKFKFKQVKAAAEKALEFAASQLGITKEELADRIVPDLGFDETMKRIFDYGERKFTVTITPSLEVEVFDEGGKKLKNLPAPGKRDDEAKATAASEEFKQMKKQMKATVSSQKLRLEMALSTERQWSVEAWKNLFVKNPIMHQFAIGLIWGIYEDRKLTTSFRYMEDGSFNTEDEDEFELPESSQTEQGEQTQFIGLVHPIELSKESLETWKQQLEDYEITQPIEQLNRAIYYRTEEEENQKSLERFGGCILNDLSLSGKLLGAGWYRGSVQDAGGFYTYYREDPELELGVELNFSGSYVGGLMEDVTVYDARFYKAGTVKRGSYEYDEADDEKSYFLKDVPERYFSEIVLQISKAVASSKDRNANWKSERR